MSVLLYGVITNVEIKRGKLPKIIVEYVADTKEKGKAVLIPGLRLVDKISKKIGKTYDAWRVGLINKKVEIIME